MEPSTFSAIPSAYTVIGRHVQSTSRYGGFPVGRSEFFGKPIADGVGR